MIELASVKIVTHEYEDFVATLNVPLLRQRGLVTLFLDESGFIK